MRSFKPETQSYIVTLRDSANAVHFKESVNKLGGSVTHEFDLIKGFTIKLPKALHMESLKKQHGDDIASVEKESTVHTQT